jgi:hypothetical protein
MPNPGGSVGICTEFTAARYYQAASGCAESWALSSDRDCIELELELELEGGRE